MSKFPDSVFIKGHITTLDRAQPEVEALAVTNGTIVAVGSTPEILPQVGPATRRIDLQGRRVIPGLIDSHMHLIRGGLNYNMELRWDGVPSLADAMAMLARAGRSARRRRNGCAWSAASPSSSSPRSACRRSTRSTRVAPDTPVFILHLYDRALLNGAALRAVGYTRDTPDPPGGEIAARRARRADRACCWPGRTR